eukprot:GHVL01017748.1.p2 GENE.GHVL01017748.1~~GHVL01017748.1.p2  ORF type:complete len:155 (+),score=39.36 GHVL01017748.1:357-821(+)
MPDGTICGRRYANTSSSSTLRYHLSASHAENPQVMAREVMNLRPFENDCFSSKYRCTPKRRTKSLLDNDPPPTDLHLIRTADAQQAMEIVETFLWERGLRPHKMLFQSVKREVFSAWIAECGKKNIVGWSPIDVTKDDTPSAPPPPPKQQENFH